MSADECLNQLEPMMAEMIVNQHRFAEKQDKVDMILNILRSKN